ncbi:ferredoxin [Streptomyces sp. HUCO-GS316]|uniref:ferredoxin n=1 Tax=Streptomyces sp. HUCO-GS316 TaxID=2692198 RepID=UPI00136C90D6|nr:ferredoxin [Streptomyces sp. HUCO-GS316]MXM69123.1 ferredoxin [Streptomyces sp. HUCO-GS316]
MRISVDREMCVGSGNCVFFAQGVFDQHPDGRVLLLVGEPDEGLRAATLTAAANCPVQAISVNDA